MLKKIDIENILYKFILIIMIALPLGKLLAYCLYLGGVIKDSFDFNQVYVLWISLPILILFYLYGVYTKRFKIDKTDIFIYGLVILGFISTIFAKDISLSIYGEQNRNEGLLTLLHYYFLFLNIKNIKNMDYQKKLIKCFIGLGIFQIIYSVLQVYTSVSFVRHFSKEYMAMGLCANPNFLGSYMVMLTSITSVLYLLKGQNKYLYLSFLFFFGICLASSTGPFLGHVLGLLFFLIFYRKQIIWKKIVFLMIGIAIVFFAHDASIHFIQSIRENKIEEQYNIKTDIEDIFDIVGNSNNKKNENSTNNTDNSTELQKKIEYSLGNGRIKLWKRTIPVAKKYFWFGAGIDNFRLVYHNDYLLEYDKAHNIYLQMLVTNGIFALSLYCILCLIIFIKGFQLKEPYLLACYIAFVAYSIQGFANISVIDVAPYFFILLGILSANIKSKKNIS